MKDLEPTPNPKTHVALAEVARPHGVRGELKLKVYNLESDVLLGRPRVRLRHTDGRVEPGHLTHVRRINGGMLATMRGVSSREAAEALRGVQLEVERALLGNADDGEFFICDLIDCEVFEGDRLVGVVVHVQNYPSCDALVIQPSEGKKREIPLVERYVGLVDVDDRRIEAHHLDELG